MKITFKSSAGARDGLSRFPTLHIPYDDCFTADGLPIRSQLVRALASPDLTVQFGATDCAPVLAFAATLIADIEKRMENIVKKSDGGAYLQGEEAIAHPNGTAERAMARGRVGFCTVRAHYRKADDVVIVRIAYGRNKTIRSDKAYEYAKDLAILVAQSCLELRDFYANNNSPVKLVVADEECCEGLCEAAVKDAAWRLECKRIDEANAARLTCEHLFGWEWCKGCKTNSPNWAQGGKCREVPKPEMPRIPDENVKG